MSFCGKRCGKLEEAFARLETRRLSGEQDVPKSPILQDFYDILLNGKAAEGMAAMEMAQRLQEVVIILVGIRCMIRAVLK